MTIYLIRHGQSEFNAAHRSGDPDPILFDAPLTALGRQQAAAASREVAALGIREVLVSPLTRALQTAQHIFGSDQPLRVEPELRERLEHSCDMGRDPGQLARAFPRLDFSDLAPVWWHQGPENRDGVPVEPLEVFRSRMTRFAARLRDGSTRPLALVAHANVIEALSGKRLANCEITRFPVNPT